MEPPWTQSVCCLMLGLRRELLGNRSRLRRFCTERPAFPASPGSRNTRPKIRPSWRLSKKRPPKPCLPFEPRSGRQADQGSGSGRGPHRPEDRPRPHPGAQGNETAMAGRSAALQIGLPVRRGLVCADRETGAALMCHAAMGGHRNKEPASQGDQPDRCKRPLRPPS